MLLTIRILLFLFGLISLITGFLGISAKYVATEVTPAIDNNHRFTAAMWFSMSIAFFYVTKYPAETTLFRFLMIAMIIGGLVRVYGLRFYSASPSIIVGIIVEIIPPLIMLWMHNQLLNSNSL